MNADYIIKYTSEIIKNISEAQDWQKLALNSLSFLRQAVSNPAIDANYNKLKEVINTNNQILDYFEKITKGLNALQSNTIHPLQATQSITRSLQKINVSAYNYGLTSTDSRSSVEKVYQDNSYVIGDTSKLCQDYNSVIDDPSRKSEFVQHYSPIRFGVINAMERRRDPNIDPVFQTASNGEYYAVAIGTSSLYAVMPRFDTTFQAYAYGPGAMGIVFDCLGYDSKLSYRRIKLKQPASFDHDRAKQQWILKRKGVLDLGQGN